jgi:hypothetical protein
LALPSVEGWTCVLFVIHNPFLFIKDIPDSRLG